MMTRECSAQHHDRFATGHDFVPSRATKITSTLPKARSMSESVSASRRVASLIPLDVPVILESRVGEADIQKEMDNVVRGLDSNVVLAIAGD